MSERRDDGVVVISADGHCGADLREYKPYLEASFHDDFDAWAATFSDGWGILDDDDDEIRVGVASFAADINWRSDARQAALEEQGIVGEVLFPNTAPPFFPSGAISAAAPGRPPADRTEYEQRFAGVRAHNRWLADFCAEVPGRRAGIGQIFLSDLDDAVAAVDEIAALGLSGVLLPGDHHDQLQHLYLRDLDAVWARCVEHDLPVGRHGVFVTGPSDESNSMAAGAIGLLESRYFTQRALAAMILSGVFERHPDLRFAITEIGAAWVVDDLRLLDRFVGEARREGTIQQLFGGVAADRLSRLPSDYFASNCFVGSFFDTADMAAAPDIGVSRMMWGADFPHHEGTSPYTREALRSNLAGLDEDQIHDVLAGVAARCYGFDLDALAVVAREVGPTLAELRRPLDTSERPRYPDDTLCATFRPA